MRSAINQTMSSDRGAETAAKAPALPPLCRIEPIEETRFLFIDEFQKVRIDHGEKPAERAVFRKQHGAAKAKVAVVPQCPADFRVGRTLHENRPLGSIADARRVAYPSSSALRRSLNGQPMGEPTQPR